MRQKIWRTKLGILLVGSAARRGLRADDAHESRRCRGHRQL